MSVYVDSAMISYGRMLMSHMLADTTEELLAMVDKIGVNRKWLQSAGKVTEHFDICMSRRDRAISAGAKPVSSKTLVRIIRRKRLARAVAAVYNRTT